MLDFLLISLKETKSGNLEVSPKFVVKKSNDLMIRGGDFYAIWDEDAKLWCTDENDAIRMIDNETTKAFSNYQKKCPDKVITAKYMWDSESGIIDKWHKYCQKQMRDSYHPLDETLIFADSKPTKRDYASRRLDYALAEGDISGYEDLMSTLYSPEERKKIEWGIGSIVQGDSKNIQKFFVLYGAPGTGKGTVIHIIEMLFQGYAASFESKALGSMNAAFPLEQFRSNPLVAYDHDGDLSRIESNTRLNSLISHENMPVNEKYRQTYSMAFKCMLFIGSNKVVKITDAKSGLIRRLIDVSPTGTTVKTSRYNRDMEKIKFELGAIAYHCRKVYLDNIHLYDSYIAKNMLGASNVFYNFIEDNYDYFITKQGVTLKEAWELYRKFKNEAEFSFSMNRMQFREELKNYFRNYEYSKVLDDGTKVYSYYSEFHLDLNNRIKIDDDTENEHNYTITLNHTDSIFDKEFADCPAQYATNEKNEKPLAAWATVITTLASIITTRVHYVKPPSNLIVIDFDLKDDTGNKSFELNLDAASKWPKTYTELSKSGKGIHLHYYYNGDVKNLSMFYAPGIEIKVFTGGSSLRRRLTKCNNLPIATINSGLPLKEEKRVVNQKQIQSEKSLRNFIIRIINSKELAAKDPTNPDIINGCEHTKPAIDFIYKVLNQAYESGMRYDLENMIDEVSRFAAGSTNNSQYCLRVVNLMKFKSADNSENETFDDNTEAEGLLAFFDVEIFDWDKENQKEYPGLFLIVWKYDGDSQPCNVMINPDPEEVDKLFIKNYLNIKWVGFNNRRYDNHMVYGRSLGLTPHELYLLSQRIITKKDQDAKFGSAYDISYADIWEYASKKDGLKKREIEMGFHHQEMGWEWDKPLPISMFDKAADYCKNDVIATEKLFHYIYGEFEAQEVLAKLATVIGGVPSKVNDNQNAITQNLLFGDDRHPQEQFEYRNLAEKTDDSMWCYKDYLSGNPKANIKYGKPYFPGYKYFYSPLAKKMISTYRDEDGSELPKEKRTPKRNCKEVREGGYVFAIPGMYISSNPGKAIIQTEDVASMHPASLIAENLFGKYTKRFADLKQLRVYIKHKDYDSARKMFGGAIAEFLKDEQSAKTVSHALKIAINKVYGMTSSPSDYFRCKDSRNIDNIVAKRGALFMIDLKNAVQDKGYTVVHCKTDSIKILNPDDYILNFVRDMGKAYGYDFETEAKFDRLCLVNDSVYVGHCTNDSPEDPGEWTFTGDEFKVPFVSKALFTHKPFVFEDYCITKSSKDGALYLDMNENLNDDTLLVAKYKGLERILREPDLDKQNEMVNRFIKRYGESDGLYLTTDTITDYLNHLADEIKACHDYQFVGRVGQFVPIKSGSGGGLLLAQNHGSYGYASGAKGYRFLESEVVRNLHKENDIDISYFITLADKSKDHISEFGDFEIFTSNLGDPSEYESPKDDMPPDFINIPEGINEEVPFEEDATSTVA